MPAEFTISFPPKEGRQISPDFVNKLAAIIEVNRELGVLRAESDTTKAPPEIRVRATTQTVKDALKPLLDAQGVLYVIPTS